MPIRVPTPRRLGTCAILLVHQPPPAQHPALSSRAHQGTYVPTLRQVPTFKYHRRPPFSMRLFAPLFRPTNTKLPPTHTRHKVPCALCQHLKGNGRPVLAGNSNRQHSEHPSPPCSHPLAGSNIHQHENKARLISPSGFGVGSVSTSTSSLLITLGPIPSDIDR